MITVLNRNSLKRYLGLFLAALLASNLFALPAAKAQNSPFCESSQATEDLIQGRSYGDPHISTFDGFNYSFQTVGEFILTHSRDRAFEVQTRQAKVPNRDNLSLNTAVAMRVCDQRVGIYIQDTPNGSSSPVWVDGQPVSVNDAFSLDNGGEIQRQGDSNYTVIWPSGEQVAIRVITVSGARFLNVMPMVGRQHRNQMFGLLGNFNGNDSDDLISRDGTILPARSTYSVASNTLSRALPAAIPVAELETAYFEQLNRQFGDSWRVTQTESLFDYPAGVTTAFFTNRSFPNQVLTLNGVSSADLETAVTECEAAGVSAEMMDGCVFDVAATGNTGFANAALNAVANVVVDRVTDRAINEIERAIPLPGGLRLPF
ncbi:VWD domain-containing protein [cf. Phormidesmis sp. LEGE 11477]|uniref:VWD domain-containing protein n=1 Tax=cf. Phormidesmis sp. LEGE 11477 TaxID=1828680 RepID=UPI00187EFE3B|nr:VWD domain-containing protein [cf. Phormidesmis sp. LEGE 11477]MBE9063706.1 VWD domain-containing protein [cf. Phormidesmis sp. LEGE 11477]